MYYFRFAALATVAVFGFSAVASAADMPTKAPVQRAPLATMYNWSGCYAGLNAGGGWARTRFTNTVNTTDFGHLLPGESFTYTYDGFVGGGQIGCNYQVSQWVFGVEGTFAGTSIKGDASDQIILFDDVFTTRINTLATVTGRVGYAWNNVLLYAKGGYAGAHVKFSVSDTCCGGGISPMGAGSDSHWQNGWTVGAGLEYGLTPNWIIGAEYNYIDVGTANYEVGGGAGSYAFDVKTRIQTVLGRVSYKFGL
jgi:outer membrane immunogenic protein